MLIKSCLFHLKSTDILLALRIYFIVMWNMKRYSASEDKSNLIWFSQKTRASAQLIIYNIHDYFLLVNSFTLSLIYVTFLYIEPITKVILLHLTERENSIAGVVSRICSVDFCLVLECDQILKRDSERERENILQTTSYQLGTIQNIYILFLIKGLLRWKNPLWSPGRSWSVSQSM